MESSVQTSQDINNIRSLTRPIPETYYPLMDECRKDSQLILKTRRSCQLCLILSGKGQLKRKDFSYEVRANRLLYFHNLTDTLQFSNCSEDFLFYQVEISFIPRNHSEGDLIPGHSWDIQSVTTNPGRLISLFDYLYQIRDLQVHPLEQKLAGSLIHAILGELYEEIKHPWARENLSLRRIREVCRIIESHPAVRYSVEELAKKVNISPSYLGHQFKEVIGLSPYRFQLQVRMAHARKLLREDRLTVARTAEICGYANPYVFSRVFKEVTGQSPGRV